MLLTMAPVQAALASGPRPLRMAISPKISSGRLPNPAFIMPPQVAPIRPASCSVAVPIHADVTTKPSTESQNRSSSFCHEGT
jgi:hypothetical protein